jgi:L-Ala-D/L-Glu epimerase / N-acetyl-D-glutamate racemase
MKLSFSPYTIQLKHRFTLSTSSRTSTPAVLTEIEHAGVVGYGEASMPPYLGESHESATTFLSKVDLTKYDSPFDTGTILSDVDRIAPDNFAAKAAVDIALHDLVGKLIGLPWYKIWGFNKEEMPQTSFTIGIGGLDDVQRRVKEAESFPILKVKLGRDNDWEIIEAIRAISDKPLYVDVNQGWRDKFSSLDVIHRLAEKGVVLVEQPLGKNAVDDTAWLTERSPLPIIADEAVQRIPDLVRAKGVYSGINIKLMKSTGMREAHAMILLARSMGMKVMIGCMTETSCAVSAASHLAPMADWADLDGALLIANDPFEGVKVIDGKILLTDRPGIGVERKLHGGKI